MKKYPDNSCVRHKKTRLLDTTAVSSISESGLILDYDLRWSTEKGSNSTDGTSATPDVEALQLLISNLSLHVMLGPVCPQRIIFLGWGYSVAPNMFLVAGAGSNLKKHLGTKWSQATRTKRSKMLGFPGILQTIPARFGTEWDPLKWQFGISYRMVIFTYLYIDQLVTVIRLDYTAKKSRPLYSWWWFQLICSSILTYCSSCTCHTFHRS